MSTFARPPELRGTHNASPMRSMVGLVPNSGSTAGVGTEVDESSRMQTGGLFGNMQDISTTDLEIKEMVFLEDRRR